MTLSKRNHAIVLGASVGGLLTARALSRHFERVTVIERDSMHNSPNPRKGVPQGRHTHALYKTGADIIEGFFPGFWDELTQLGSRKTDVARDFIWFHHGTYKDRAPCGIPMYCQSRPFLDYHVRRRLLAEKNVTIESRQEAIALLHDDTTHTVQGVRTKALDNGAEIDRPADFVVDVTGRGTKTPRWLESLGYGRPKESAVKINVGYSTCLMAPPKDAAHHWTSVLIYPSAPQQTRVGYIFPVEGNRWIVTLCGYLGDYPPSDEDGFMAFAQTLPRPELYEAIRHAKPLSKISVHRLPSNLRRHYERMRKFPSRFAVLGDAVCSFNPLFGQGITTAALGTRVLAETLDHWPHPSLDGIGQAVQQGIVANNDVAWLLATSEDLRYPSVPGRRPLWMPFLQWYTHRLLQGSGQDPVLNRAFIKTVTFQQGIAALLTPDIIRRTLFAPQHTRGPEPAEARAYPGIREPFA